MITSFFLMAARSMLSRDMNAKERSKGWSVWLDKDDSIEGEPFASDVAGGCTDVLVTATKKQVE
jgi:hypothetical protein